MSKIDRQKNKNIELALRLRSLPSSKRAPIISALLNGKSTILELECSEQSLDPKEERQLGRILERCKRDQLGIITIFDAEYPNALKNIYDPPPLFFYKGNPSLLGSKIAVAVVGSRNGDLEGINIAMEFGQELALSNTVIVSGLAMGIDSAAHRGAINSGVKGATIAVLGNGLPSISPPSNIKLAEEILAAGGLIISQFLPNEPGYKQNFLDRNRVISGLSSAVVVIQATERSGSLVTARHGLEQGREVLVVPGSVKNNRYAGSNKLLMDGAFLVRNGRDVLELIFGSSNHNLNIKEQQPEVFGDQYLKILRKFGPLSLEELKDRSGNPPKFHTDILELEMSGRIILKPGNMVVVA